MEPNVTDSLPQQTVSPISARISAMLFLLGILLGGSFFFARIAVQ
jgi:hypothetical protein